MSSRGRERRDRLGKLAQRIGCAEPPYYLYAPRRPSEPAPGWYWVAAGDRHPSYLGYSSVDAEIKLRALLDREATPS